jgi:hypothetical protein
MALPCEEVLMQIYCRFLFSREHFVLDPAFQSGSGAAVFIVLRRIGRELLAVLQPYDVVGVFIIETLLCGRRDYIKGGTEQIPQI